MPTQAQQDPMILQTSSCSYEVDFDDFVGARPVFRITSTGTSGNNSRVVDVQVVQEVTGWVMGKCRIPKGTDVHQPGLFCQWRNTRYSDSHK